MAILKYSILPTDYSFNGNLGSTKLGCTHPNYFGNANEWVKRPIIHLFKFPCSCCLKYVYPRQLKCWVSSVVWKTQISEVTCFLRLLLFSSGVSRLVCYEVLTEVHAVPGHSDGSVYYIIDTAPVLESFSFLWAGDTSNCSPIPLMSIPHCSENEGLLCVRWDSRQQ